ncbi:MAG: DeoR/GlpR family DNA-binding transcription regulator [Pelolinea sp.]|nr:DeoR/GlpR family DNA-binding transcription regulator [Pelolinea sp.]
MFKLKEERQRIIVNEIKNNGSVMVADLAKKFNVSCMTIRRDLKEIEVVEVLKRTYGGAILSIKDKNHSEPPTLDRMDLMRKEKNRIAHAAAELVHEKEMIFLGSGTTTLYVAQALQERDDITVVSNALTILNYLATNGKMNLIGVGGFLRRKEFSMIGHFADKVISDLRMDKVIMGMRGVHPRFGLTSDHPQELLTDRTIMGISDTVIIVADHTKIGHVATSRTAPVEKASLLITSVEAPIEIVNAIISLGVRVELV